MKFIINWKFLKLYTNSLTISWLKDWKITKLVIVKNNNWTLKLLENKLLIKIVIICINNMYKMMTPYLNVFSYGFVKWPTTLSNFKILTILFWSTSLIKDIVFKSSPWLRDNIIVEFLEFE